MAGGRWGEGANTKGLTKVAVLSHDVPLHSKLSEFIHFKNVI